MAISVKIPGEINWLKRARETEKNVLSILILMLIRVTQRWRRELRASISIKFLWRPLNYIIKVEELMIVMAEIIIGSLSVIWKYEPGVRHLDDLF